MRLSMQDKNELLKAAWKSSTTGDLDGLAAYLVSLVEAIDALPDNKSDAQAPPYKRFGDSIPTQAQAYGPLTPPADWPNGLYQQSLSGDE